MTDNWLKKHNQTQKELIERLRSYSTALISPDKIEAELESLSTIYTDGFRHDYSDFFKLITLIYKDSENSSIEYLQNNLEMIKNAANISSKAKETVKKGILKLCDHINLEIIRYTAQLATQKTFEDEVNEAQNQLQESQELNRKIKTELEESKSKLDEAKQKIARVQGESIAIISIFLAFTLAFTGGLSYISSAISSLAEAPIERIITIVILCGLIVFNTMYVLLHIVIRLIGKNIEINQGNNCITRFFNKYKLFLIVNFILISFLIYPFIKCFN